MADEQKSTFTISDAEIVFKLHEAAVKKAEDALKKGGKNYAIVNTGVGKKTKFKDTFANKDGLYEVGVVLQLDKFENAEKKDLQTKEGDAEKKEQNDVEENNKKILKEGQDACMNALNQYFIWFAGKDSIKTAISTKTAKAFNLSDPTNVKSLVQDYKDFTIPSLDEKKLEEIRSKKKDLKPIIGYKVGFQLIYEGKE